MTPENIKENNIKISKFMKLTYNHLYVNILDNKNVLNAKDLEYHRDWNWLMPVVKKCFSAKDNDKMSELTSKFDFWKLDAMYNAVIEYIDWYNTQ